MSTMSVTPSFLDKTVFSGPERSLSPVYILSCRKFGVFGQPLQVTCFSRRKNDILKQATCTPKQSFKTSGTIGIISQEYHENDSILDYYTYRTTNLSTCSLYVMHTLDGWVTMTRFSHINKQGRTRNAK